ncbi:outer membrane beta-barrel protein [Xinfangfangia sp. CPCC 101601]|uniref:Outer membrane beta-barrel protein n=1 Tax=Pseudogemmobacter lacusdianii TaxID=3069608 RepID=A0ABU0W383_9RHOB|nr:outer membrane beta-barrel protein [Xinfangfangia sp. CPCC 101601]MDQ2067545.1 outer membrane beta-barrel protein [Xinfangfangia sp. CPCC 101601]
MSYVSKLAIALAASVAATTSASAGGLAEHYEEAAPAKVSAAPAFSWEGFYVGGSLGGKRNRLTASAQTSAGGITSGGSGMGSGSGSGSGYSTGTGSDPVASTSSHSASGISASVFIGHNWDRNGLVYGVEGSIGHANTDILSGENAFEQGLNAALRLRVGTALDRTLLYVAGGVAASKVKLISEGASESATMTGWTFGAGAEHAFTNNWLGRIEVNYSDYGDHSFSIGDAPTIELEQTELVIGLAYKF